MRVFQQTALSGQDRAGLHMQCIAYAGAVTNKKRVKHLPRFGHRTVLQGLNVRCKAWAALTSTRLWPSTA